MAVETNLTANIELIGSVTADVVVYFFLVVAVIIIMAIFAAHRDTTNTWRWTDLVRDYDGKSSLSRILQLIAGITGTFIVIFATITGSLGVEMFIAYLAALGLSEGVSKWLSLRYGLKDKDFSEKK